VNIQSLHIALIQAMCLFYQLVVNAYYGSHASLQPQLHYIVKLGCFICSEVCHKLGNLPKHSFIVTHCCFVCLGLHCMLSRQSLNLLCLTVGERNIYICLIMNHDSGFIIGIAMIFCQNSNRTYA